MRIPALIFVALAWTALAASGCARTPGEVVEKVKYDFGFGERPTDYESGEDRVMRQLSTVGERELERLNRESGHGEVLFEEEGMLRGKFFLQKKVYENFFPTHARAHSQNQENERGYVGYIRYEYALYESPRQDTRAGAEAGTASIRTGETRRETYRYTFSRGGVWNGQPGELVR